MRQLSQRGFADESCVIVKTDPGRDSGVTHAGGRYVHSQNPYAEKVERVMVTQGIHPPTRPFIITPGETTLYHEWGHHADLSWTRDDDELPFSFRWFSHFYEIEIRDSSRARTRRLESLEDGAEAVYPWHLVSSELFAELFEDWMRGSKRQRWDCTDPKSINLGANEDSTGRLVQVRLLPGMKADQIRNRAYELFESGLHTAKEKPELRADLFGKHTAEIAEQYVEAKASLSRRDASGD